MGEKFLSRIVAIDKTLVRSYEPGLKRQSADWYIPSSSRIARFRRVQSKLQMRMIFAYNILGVLITHKAPVAKRSTMNTTRSRVY